MKKQFKLVDDDLDLILIMKIIWKEKLKIFFITSISILCAIFYYFNQEKSYKISIMIKPVQNEELAKFYLVNNSIRELFNTNFQNSSYSVDNTFQNLYLDQDKSLKRFLIEISDYKKLMLSLEKNQIIMKKILSSIESKEDQKKILNNIIRSLTFSGEKTRISDNIVISFEWPETVEVKEILKQIIEYSIINLENSYISEIKTYKEVFKEQLSIQNLNKIKILEHFKNISKDFDQGIKLIINYNDKNNDNFEMLNFFKNPDEIEKEIESIKNYEDLLMTKFDEKIEKLIDMDLKWVNYDTSSINSIFTGISFNRLLILSIGIGFVFGMVLILILNEFKSKNI